MPRRVVSNRYPIRWEENDTEWACELDLVLVSMKNGRRPSNNRVGRCSEAAEQFKKDAVRLMKMCRPMKFKAAPEDSLCLQVTVRYASNLPDLDCELIPDCLQLAKVIPNDRQFREKSYYADDTDGEPYVGVRVTKTGRRLAWK